MRPLVCCTDGPKAPSVPRIAFNSRQPPCLNRPNSEITEYRPAHSAEVIALPITAVWHNSNAQVPMCT